jgi:hypothetical protein
MVAQLLKRAGKRTWRAECVDRATGGGGSLKYFYFHFYIDVHSASRIGSCDWNSTYILK